MKKHWVVVATVVAVSGCASLEKLPISTAAANDLKGQSVVRTKRPVPDFAAMTAGKAAFAMLGAAAMISEGNAIVATNKVPDPADAIAADLIAMLQADRGTRPSPSNHEIPSAPPKSAVLPMPPVRQRGL